MNEERFPERFQNMGNLLGGAFSSWALLLAAGLMLNKGILTDADPMTGQEVLGTALALFMLSVLIYRFLCDSWVEVRPGWINIRNPIYNHRVPISHVVKIHWEGKFWPVLLVASGGEIKLMGIQQSNMDLMAGGSTEVKDFVRTLEEVASTSDGTGMNYSRSVARVTWGSGTLLFFWILYGISFIVF